MELGFITEAQLADARARGAANLSDTLLALGHITQPQLKQALDAVKSTTRPRLGDVLVEMGAITTERLEQMLQLQASSSEARHLGQLLVETGTCSYEQVFDGLRVQSSGASKQRRVMIVDDSMIVCSVLTQGLLDLGYEVVSFEDPLRALAELDKVQPDIVVSDLDMPGLDGATLCKRLKELSQGQLPVIILTANESETAIAGLQAGADDYVKKGTSMEELGARIDTILRRTNETSRVRKMFARYTSDAVVDQVLQANGDVVLTGEKRDVTVLFADIRNFTSFAETQSPERVMSTVNDVLGRLADAVLANGGTIDKFLGDGLMAVFGAPLRLVDDPQRAVAAARQMLVATAQRNATCNPELALEVGIAVNTGPVVAGSIGNERRTEYTCIGDTVNVASRLCAVADAGQILVGAGTVERFEDRAQFESLDPVRLKGKAQPVPVFRAK